MKKFWQFLVYSGIILIILIAIFMALTWIAEHWS